MARENVFKKGVFQFTAKDTLKIKGNLQVTGTLATTGAQTQTGTFTPNGGLLPSPQAVTAAASPAVMPSASVGNFVTVTSGNAAHIVSLPAAANAPVGTVIRGWVGANGFELRTFAASNETINNVDSDGTQQAAIPATTKFKVEKVSSTAWILTAEDELGAVITAIVPD